MGPILASAGAFAIGLFVMASMSPNIVVKDSWRAFQVAGLCGLASALLGKLVVAILSLILLPILLAGPLGVFVLHALFNGALLFGATTYLDGFSFKSVRTLGLVAAGLTLVQMIVRAGA
ncbi:MAG: hypothetical protein KC486_24255 [Myxococcales bacterium]|nr:hypothetical protein [Myxococcales bacterium]